MYFGDNFLQLSVMKALEGEWYVVIKAYEFTVFERLFVLLYIACPCYYYIIIIIESTHSMIPPE